MDFMTTVKEFAATPIFPWLGWIIMSALVLILTGSVLFKSKLSPIKKTFGAESLPHWLTLLMIAIWGAIALTLTIGLLILITEIVVILVTTENEGTFRFLLAKTTALTAVLGAVVALPFTVLRLKLSTEQNRHNQDVLYNEKLHNAITDLHARYQRTDGEGADRRDIWEDDIIRRVGAIDRLQALVEERHEEAPRIARTLCVYLKEMTREHPAVPYPEDPSEANLKVWREKVSAQKRADMEAAAQVLGRFPRLLRLDPETDGADYCELAINLSGTNLQGMDLSRMDYSFAEMNFAHLGKSTLTSTQIDRATLNQATLNEADLTFASLTGTSLIGAELYQAMLERTLLEGQFFISVIFDRERRNVFNYNDRIQYCFTDLRGIRAKGAALRSVNLENVGLAENLISGSFGDASVTLPDYAKHLVTDKWPDTILSDDEFNAEWEQFKKLGRDAYTPPQLRDAKT